jgi:hypothetical protein
MHIPHRRRLVYAGTIFMVIVYISAIILLTLSDGCTIGARFNSSVRGAYDLRIYAPFDNSGDSGPNFLVGPPDDLSEYEAGIDDGRSTNTDKPAMQSPGTPTITGSNTSGPDLNHRVDSTPLSKDPNH